MFSSGYRTKEAIEGYQKLEIARKKYAKDMLEKEIIEKDAAAKEDKEKFFPETKINSKYNSLHKDSYFAIIVKYNTAKEVSDALAQLGIKIVPKEVNVSDSYSKWVWTADEVELTVAEITQTMIDLYNTQNSYKVTDFPLESLSLVEGKQYTIKDGKYKFNTSISETDEDLNKLNYTQAELLAINKGVLTQVKTNLES